MHRKSPAGVVVGQPMGTPLPPKLIALQLQLCMVIYPRTAAIAASGAPVLAGGQMPDAGVQVGAPEAGAPKI